MKSNLEFRKKTPVIIQKGIIQSLIQEGVLLYEFGKVSSLGFQKFQNQIHKYHVRKIIAAKT